MYIRKGHNEQSHDKIHVCFETIRVNAEMFLSCYYELVIIFETIKWNFRWLGAMYSWCCYILIRISKRVRKIAIYFDNFRYDNLYNEKIAIFLIFVSKLTIIAISSVNDNFTQQYFQPVLQNF